MPRRIELEKLHEAIMIRINYFKNNVPTSEQIEQDYTINTILDEVQKPEFEQKVFDILSEYKKLCLEEESKIVDISEMRRKKKSVSEQRLEDLIIKYINIASDYIRIQVYSRARKKSTCPNCREDFEEDEYQGSLMCTFCGFEASECLFQTAKETQNSGHSGYENSGNFEKKMARKQGKLHSDIPPNLFEKLDAYFVSQGYKTGEEIRAQECLPNGEKKGTSLEILTKALSSIKMSNLYGDSDYICHVYWGWTLLNFEEYEKDLVDLYHRTQNVYNSMESKSREAALNTEVRLYLQLLSLGFKVDRSRFRFQESQDSLEFHQKAWSYMCAMTNTPCYSIF